LAGLSVDPAAALADGRAMDTWRRMVAAQGGDPDAPLPLAAETTEVVAPASGVLTEIDAFAVGIAAWRLGAGRARKEDAVSAAAGVMLRHQRGAVVQAGEVLAVLHADDAARFPGALEALSAAFSIGAQAGESPPRVLERVG
jgi:thymidine phosphorylase